MNYTDNLLRKPAGTGSSDTITKQLHKIPKNMKIILQQYENVEALIVTGEPINTQIFFQRD